MLPKFASVQIASEFYSSLENLNFMPCRLYNGLHNMKGNLCTTFSVASAVTYCKELLTA